VIRVAYDQCAGLMLRLVASSGPREILHHREISIISYQAPLTE
jgi:hypothetical protein